MKILCKIIGHKNKIWKNVGEIHGIFIDQISKCERCGKINRRSSNIN